MNQAASNSTIAEFCVRHKMWIAIPIGICLIISVAYAMTSQRKWKAGQTLVLRDDLLGQSFKPGRFPSQESLKNAQETLLHISKKSSIIGEALRATYPDKANDPAWPSQFLIESTRDDIAILAPNGAEFGKTDVVILNVNQAAPETSAEFATNLANQIAIGARTFRADVLKSMESELQLQSEQAETEYAQIAKRVNEMVQSVGTDLDSLKAFVDSNGGTSELQRNLSQLQSEKMRAQNELEQATKQLEMLAQSRDHQQIATNGELLQLQPTLKRLVDGLVDAKIKFSQDQSKYRPGHPAFINSKLAVETTTDMIANEIQSIENGLKTQVQLAEQKVAFFANEEARIEKRLLSVNEKVVEYQTLIGDFAKRSESLATLQTSLAEIRSLADSANHVNLVTIVGEPELATSPAGLSRALIVFAGLIGGLLIGVGCAIIVNDPKLSGGVLIAAATVREIAEGVIQFRRPVYSPRKKQKAEAFVRPFGSGTSSTNSVRPIKLVKNSGPSPIANDNTLNEPADVSESSSPSEQAAPANPSSDKAWRSKLNAYAATNKRASIANKKSTQSNGGYTPSPLVVSETHPQPNEIPTDLAMSPESHSNGSGKELSPASGPMDPIETNRTSTHETTSNRDSTTMPLEMTTPAPDLIPEDDTASRTNPPGVHDIAFAEQDEADQELVERTVDLQELQRLLSAPRNESSKGSTSTSNPELKSEAKSSETKTAVSIEPKSDAGRIQKDLHNRLSNLTTSISAFCEPVRRDNNE